MSQHLQQSLSSSTQVIGEQKNDQEVEVEDEDEELNDELYKKFSFQRKNSIDKILKSHKDEEANEEIKSPINKNNNSMDSYENNSNSLKKRVKLILDENNDNQDNPQDTEQNNSQSQDNQEKEEQDKYYSDFGQKQLTLNENKNSLQFDEIKKTQTQKIKPPSIHPQVKSKKLQVQIIDIKSGVPSDFEVNQVIAEIESEEVPILCGKDDDCKIKFRSDNAYIAGKQFRIEYKRPHFSLIDIGSEYPTLIRLEPSKKILLCRYDYISLSEQSDFYIMDLVTDDANAQILNDGQELRYFDDKNEPKISNKKSITLKFHDGALQGNKFVLESKRTTVGRSNNRDLIIPSSASTVSKLHSTIMYEKGYWYIQDHSTYGTFLYPRTVVEMKNQSESSRIKILNNMKISVGGHMIIFKILK